MCGEEVHEAILAVRLIKVDVAERSDLRAVSNEEICEQMTHTKKVGLSFCPYPLCLLLAETAAEIISTSIIVGV